MTDIRLSASYNVDVIGTVRRVRLSRDEQAQLLPFLRDLRTTRAQSSHDGLT